MQCGRIMTLEQTCGGRITLVLAMTVLWWACAVGVTIVLKTALGGAAGSHGTGGDGHNTWIFPYPLTLTLFANIGTAAATGVFAASLQGWRAYLGLSDEAAQSPRAQGVFRGCCGYGRRRHGWATSPVQLDQVPAEVDILDQDEGAGANGRAVEAARNSLFGCWQAPCKLLRGDRGAIILIGLLQGLALGVKNEALLFLSVSTRTMIFATNVLVVMLVARVFGLEILKRAKLLAAVLLAFGGVLQGIATWQQMKRRPARTDDPLGCALAALALLLDALRWVLLQAVFARPTGEQSCSQDMLDTGPVHSPVASPVARANRALRMRLPPAIPPPPLSKFSMVSWVMWMTTPVCLGLCVIFEPAGLLHATRNPAALVRLVTLLTLGVMGINIAEFGVVQWTSAVTFNVLSQLHSIPMVLAGVVCFGEEVALVQIIGFAVCLAGAVLYSSVRAREQHCPEPLPEREQEDRLGGLPHCPAHTMEVSKGGSGVHQKEFAVMPATLLQQGLPS